MSHVPTFWADHETYWYHSVVRWWSWLFAPVAVSVAVTHAHVCEWLDIDCPITTVGESRPVARRVARGVDPPEALFGLTNEGWSRPGLPRFRLLRWVQMAVAWVRARGPKV